MEAVVYYTLAAFIVLVMAAPAIIAFGHGWRKTYLNEMPLLTLLFFSFGIALLDALADWIVPDADAPGMIERLLWAAAIFAGGSVIWIVGLLAGRWWRGRHDGELAGR